ncbi:hypothetical protein QL285_052614 [Trifolium repens]|nr:hypothetical protein QL285_052614 [Trifolium repens]
MVETFRNCFSLVSNDGLVDRYIKWNNNNNSCVILNVDRSCFDFLVQSRFDGIIRTTFGHYLAGFIQGSSNILFVELYAIYNGLLLTKDTSFDELVCYLDSLHCVNFINGPQVKYYIHVVLI